MSEKLKRKTNEQKNLPKKLQLTLMNYCLILIAALVILIAAPGKNYACMMVCWSDGSCTEMEGDCSTVCAGSNGYPTCTNTSMIFRPTDYILTENGLAWVVTDDKKIPVASDNLATLMTKLAALYPVGERESKKAQIKIKASFDSFFKKKDNGKVSKERLEVLSKETGLRILDKEPGK